MNEYTLEEIPPMARHINWSEPYSIFYRYDRSCKFSDMEIVYGPSIPYMIWIELDNELWLNYLDSLVFYYTPL